MLEIGFNSDAVVFEILQPYFVSFDGLAHFYQNARLGTVFGGVFRVGILLLMILGERLFSHATQNRKTNYSRKRKNSLKAVNDCVYSKN